MTLDEIKTAVSAYINASKIAGTWTNSSDNLIGLLDKIGKTVTLDGLFQDKLAIFDGEELPLGKTIEEWYQDLATISDYSDTTDPNAPNYPSYQEPSYSYDLGRKVIKTTFKYNDYNKAAISEEALTQMCAMVLKRLYDTYAMFKYDAKKEILNKLISACTTKGGELVENIAIPSDTASGEAFVKEVKADIETASFASEGHSLNGNTIGAEQGLVLVVKKGIKPILDVEVMSGAFNQDKLLIPCDIVVVDDFGGDTSGTFAVLIDKRGIRLHQSYQSIREQINGAGDFVNYFLHTDNTAFYSKNVFVKVYKEA